MPPLSAKSKYAYLNSNQDVIFDVRYIPADFDDFEVLVKISACGLTTNLESNEFELSDAEIDHKLKSLGSDVCGVVEKIGSKVKTLRVGDQVAGVIPASYLQSGCGEHVVFEEYDLVRIPENVNLLDVAACIGDCIRAYIALFYCAKITKEDTILVLNGAKPCSNVCIQLANDIGAKVLTTCTSSSQKAFLESFGVVDGVIDLNCDKNISSVLYNECMKKTDNLGSDVILDLESKKKPKIKNGSLTAENIISCLTLHGRWVTSDDKLQLDPPDSQKLHGRCASLNFLHEQAWLMSKIAQGKYQHILRDAMKKLESNVIRPCTYVSVNFESVPQVIRQLNKDNDVNKIVVSIS